MIALNFGPGNIEFQHGQILCGIIHDDTPVLFVESCSRILGYEGKSQTWLHDFILHLSRFIPVSVDVLDDLSEPDMVNLKGEPRAVISAQDFVQLCEIIATANEAGYLYASELKYARRAKAIADEIGGMDLFKKINDAVGLTAFIGTAKESVGRILSRSGTELTQWMRALPDPFFDGILAMRGWKWAGIRPHLEELAAICSDILFSRLAKATLDRLSGTKPKMRYKKAGNITTYVLDASLQEVSAVIVSIMEATNHDWHSFRLLLDRQLPVVSENMAVKDQLKNNSDAKLSFFKENLEKALQSGKFR